MTLDQYKLCPCGSGKKIKFCCSRELIHELDRIDRMVQGDQRLAALDKIEALLSKHPDNPALLMTKAEIEFKLEELPKARTTLERLTQVSPKNPNVAAMQSLLAMVVDHDMPAAINHLQDAYEFADKTIPPWAYEATVMLGTVLVAYGLPAAAKGHCSLAVALSGAKDQRSSQALMQLNHDRNIPLLIREPFVLLTCPSNVTWKIEFDEAMKQLYQGRWRRASQMLAAMSVRILDAPAILYNLAITQTWLGNNAEAVKALQQFARIRDVPLDDRVDAIALAQLLDPDMKRRMVDVIERTHEVQQFDVTMERLLSDVRFRRVTIPPEAAGDAETPLPRGAFQVFTTPFPAELSNLQVDDLPEQLGIVLLFGKETDRPARLVIQSPEPVIDPLESLCAELLGDAYAPTMEERVASEMPWFEVVLLRRKAVPRELSFDDQRRLASEIARRGISERWTTTPSPQLDGKTPTDAAAESQYKLAVLADLLNLEIEADNSDWNIDFNALRRQLNLPTRDPIDANQINLEQLPVHRFTQLTFDGLTDEQLLTVYRRSYAMMVVGVLRRAALAVTERESLDDKVDKVEAYDILSDVAANSDEALEYLAKSRRLATAEGESPAAWLIDEMEIRLLRREYDKFLQLFKEIRSRYMNEPGIMTSLVAVLGRYGLVTPDGRLVIPAEPGAGDGGAAREETPAIWTPGSEAAATDAGAVPAKPESKLWIPGMD